MARPRKAIRPVEKTISLPEDVVARVDMVLFSELEGKVPHGKWSGLVEDLLRQYLMKTAPGEAE